MSTVTGRKAETKEDYRKLAESSLEENSEGLLARWVACAQRTCSHGHAKEDENSDANVHSQKLYAALVEVLQEKNA